MSHRITINTSLAGLPTNDDNSSNLPRSLNINHLIREAEKKEKLSFDQFIEEKVIPDVLKNCSDDSDFYVFTFENDNKIKLRDNSGFNNELHLKLPKGWKYNKVEKSRLITYGSTELRVYEYNMKIKKIQLYRYDIRFLSCIIKFNSDNSKLDSKDFDNIFEYIKNEDKSLYDWISNLAKQEDFLELHGDKFLNSAIKQSNRTLIVEIINTTLEYFKKDPKKKKNIKILSTICINMNHLALKYPDLLLDYSNEMILCTNSSKVFYRKFDHLSYFLKDDKDDKDDNDDNDDTQILNSLLFYIFVKFPFILIFPCDHIYKTAYNIFYNKPVLPRIKFIVPFSGYLTYPKNYNPLKELFFKPEPSVFSQVKFNELYKTWNGEVIIKSKWESFGRYYYTGIWLLFTTFLICFTLVSSVSSEIINEKARDNLLISSIIIGFIHLSFEVRQFIWDPVIWALNVLNWFDLGAYLLPTITSIYWIRTGTEIVSLSSISCLLLDIKFMFFFQAFESFGIYFAIILGVGRKIFSFLFILFLIIISFAHAFLILLKPQGNLNDSNDPWALTTKYHQILENGIINPNATLVQEPDEYTNLFSDYSNALLSMYLFLTGDPNSLSAWSPKDNPIMIVLMILFSFVIVVYLMNLFIGLLNMAIIEDNNQASYLAEKAEILKEIELFYLLPYQRRKEKWFPPIIYYYADVNETHKLIKQLKDDKSWGKISFEENKNNLSKLLRLEVKDQINYKEQKK